MTVFLFCRHLLISQQVLGTVPTIVFLRDKEAAAVREVRKKAYIYLYIYYSYRMTNEILRSTSLSKIFTERLDFAATNF